MRSLSLRKRSLQEEMNLGKVLFFSTVLQPHHPFPFTVISAQMTQEQYVFYICFSLGTWVDLYGIDSETLVCLCLSIWINLVTCPISQHIEVVDNKCQGTFFFSFLPTLDRRNILFEGLAQILIPKNKALIFGLILGQWWPWWRHSVSTNGLVNGQNSSRSR